jgi:hypothetical protein
MATAPGKGSSRSAQVRAVAAVAMAVLFFTVSAAGATPAAPRRILVDTDMDTDDLLALLYLLKQNRSEFDVKVGAMSRSILVVRTCYVQCRRRSTSFLRVNPLVIE